MKNPGDELDEIEKTAGNAPEAAGSDGAGDITAKPAPGALTTDEIDRMTNAIIEALKTVYDPEIPVDVYELGLIYKIDISEDRNIEIDMTLTAPGCPVAGEMPVWVQNAVGAVEGVQEVKVNMVFEPFWTPDRMSEEARVALNMF